ASSWPAPCSTRSPAAIRTTWTRCARSRTCAAGRWRRWARDCSSRWENAEIEGEMRELRDEQGAVWRVVAEPAVVAHGRRGAVLAFRPADDAGAEPLFTTVTFNSMDAAEFAISTLGEKELL